MTDPWRKQRQGAPSVRRFIQERSPAASHGFSRIAKHETWLFCNPPWSRRPTACQGFGVTNHETRNTAVPSWFPAHDFPPFPTISQVPPPKKNQVPPRTAAAGSAASWLPRVAAHASLACLSRRLARRSTSGSRIKAGTVHRPSEMSPWSEPGPRPWFSRVTAFPSRASAVGW